MLRISALLALTVLVLLGNFTAAGIPIAHAQKTDPFEFPPEIILDKDWAAKRDRAERQRIYDGFMSDPLHRSKKLVAEGRIDEGLVALREGLDAPCDDQACQARSGLYFVYFIWSSSSSWTDEQFHSLMQEARGVIERVEGAKRHDLMSSWYLVDGWRADDKGDLPAYEAALNAAREEIALIRAEGDAYAGMAMENEIGWLQHWATLKAKQNMPDAAFESLRQALELTRQKPDMVRDDPVPVLIHLSDLFAESDPARSKKYHDEACDLYDQAADPVRYKRICQASPVAR